MKFAIALTLALIVSMVVISSYTTSVNAQSDVEGDSMKVWRGYYKYVDESHFTSISDPDDTSFVGVYEGQFSIDDLGYGNGTMMVNIVRQDAQGCVHTTTGNTTVEVEIIPVSDIEGSLWIQQDYPDSFITTSECPFSGYPPQSEFIFIVPFDLQPWPYLIQLKEGFSDTQVVTETDDEHMDYKSSRKRTFSVTIGGEPAKYEIRGKVSTFNGKQELLIPEAKMFLINYDKVGSIYGSEQPRLEKLSKSLPEFDKVIATDSGGGYEFSIDSPPTQKPKVVVGSVLWYDKNTFSVTNGGDVVDRKIPVYVVACVDDNEETDCVKWEKNSDGNYEAVVDFVYGDESTVTRHDAAMAREDWNFASSGSFAHMLNDAGVIYHNSYKAMKYLEDVGGAIGSPPNNPVVIQILDSSSDCMDQNGNPEDHAFFEDEKGLKFGGLGKGLDSVEATGGTIHVCDKRSDFAAPDAPINREWHELSHYFQYYMYGGAWDDKSNSINHNGYGNPTTNDSVIEGFAEFNAMLIAEYYGSPTPYLYNVRTIVLNLEEDYQVWGNMGPSPSRTVDSKSSSLYEELAVAGILWDLHDKGKEIDLTTSKVYPESTDDILLDRETILKTILKNRPLLLADLYGDFALVANPSDVDMIFVNHGAFSDTVQRNFVQDTKDEKPGYTGSSIWPNRPVRQSPRPALPGSYLISTSDAAFSVNVVHEAPYSNYDFSYQIDMQANSPTYFEMPPSYFPSKAVFREVLEDGRATEDEIMTIDSNEYWDYILSEPAEGDIFRTLPESASGRADNTSSTQTESSTASQTSSQGGGGCLIATAAFGSELSPQVQFLRNFRDDKILSTMSGSSFMNVFNAWYYSFSPHVADYERGQPWMREVVKSAIHPLLGILTLSENAYSSIPGEFGALSAGLVASSLIGAVYFGPIAFGIKQLYAPRKKEVNYKLLVTLTGVAIAATIVSILVENPTALMITTSLFVLTVAASSAILAALLVSRTARAIRTFMTRRQ